MRAFEDNFTFAFTPLRLIMAHPDIPRNTKWIVKFIILNIFASFGPLLLIYSTLCFDLKSKEINKIFANGMLLGLYNYVNFMYFLLLYWQEPLKDVLMKIRKDYKNARTLPEEERTLFEQYANTGNKMTKISSYNTILTGCLFLSTAVIQMMYSAFSGEFQLLPPYDMTFPEVIETKKHELSGFSIIWIISIIFDIYIVLIYMGFSAIGPMCMIHAAGQLEILKTKIDKVFNVPEKEYDERAAHEKLKEISITLEDIYKFVNTVNRCLVLHHEVLFKVTPLFMPFSMFLVIWNLRRGQVHLDFLSNFIGFFVSVSLPSYYSDILMKQGLNVREALYESGWVKHYDRKSRTMILLLILRTSKSVTLKTLFRPLSLDALTDVVNQTYTVLNLLNTAYS